MAEKGLIIAQTFPALCPDTEECGGKKRSSAAEVQGKRFDPDRNGAPDIVDEYSVNGKSAYVWQGTNTNYRSADEVWIGSNRYAVGTAIRFKQTPGFKTQSASGIKIEKNADYRIRSVGLYASGIGPQGVPRGFYSIRVSPRADSGPKDCLDSIEIQVPFGAGTMGALEAPEESAAARNSRKFSTNSGQVDRCEVGSKLHIASLDEREFRAASPIYGSGVHIYRSSQRPELLMLDYPDTDNYRKAFNRISSYQDITPGIILDSSEMDFSALGSNLKITVIADFFSEVLARKIVLNRHERELRAVLLAAGVLSFNDGHFLPGDKYKYVIALGAGVHEQRRERPWLADHELDHATFTLDPDYRNALEEYWNEGLNPADQKALAAILALTGYCNSSEEEPECLYVIRDEAYAYARATQGERGLTDLLKGAREICSGHLDRPHEQLCERLNPYSDPELEEVFSGLKRQSDIASASATR